MPTYRYRCDRCGEELEVWQSFSDEPLKVHEKDGGELRKVLSPAGIVLKGSGFYKTDNRSSGRNGGKRSDSGDSSSKESSSKESSSSSKDSGSKDSGSKDSSSSSSSKSDSGSKSSSSS